MEFSKQEYWSRLPFLTPGDLPNPGFQPVSFASPVQTGGVLFFFFHDRAAYEELLLNNNNKGIFLLNNLNGDSIKLGWVKHQNKYLLN